MIQPFDFASFVFLVSAAKWTIGLTLLAMLAGGAVGLVVALARVSQIKVIRIFGSCYIGIIQGIPVLVILFLAFFGLSRAGIDLSPLTAAAVSMSLFASGYFADIWRGAIQSVQKEQWEASASLALSRFQQYRYIILPQAVRISLPPTVGFLVQLVKNTSIVSIIGAVELARAGQILSTATFKPLPVFLCTAAIYFVICFPLSYISRRLEVKFAQNGNH